MLVKLYYQNSYEEIETARDVYPWHGFLVIAFKDNSERFVPAHNLNDVVVER